MILNKYCLVAVTYVEILPGLPSSFYRATDTVSFKNNSYLAAKCIFCTKDIQKNAKLCG